MAGLLVSTMVGRVREDGAGAVLVAPELLPLLAMPTSWVQPAVQSRELIFETFDPAEIGELPSLAFSGQAVAFAATDSPHQICGSR